MVTFPCVYKNQIEILEMKNPNKSNWKPNLNFLEYIESN
jgi:hypothetical protein